MYMYVGVGGYIIYVGIICYYASKVESYHVYLGIFILHSSRLLMIRHITKCSVFTVCVEG